MLESEVDGERAAHRAAHQVSRLTGQLVHQRKKVSDRRPWFRRQLRITEAALVEPDDVELVRKRRDLWLPHAKVRDACVQ
jgi:hypothetical protein